MEKGHRRSIMQRAVVLAALLVCGVLLAATGVAAQNCAMCYDAARQQSGEASRALNVGIVVLLLPSLLLFGGVIATALRHREAEATEE